ncbi:MAG: hypothetical protein ABH884_03100 [Candidatus Komeilibacteria bacterium]
MKKHLRRPAIDVALDQLRTFYSNHLGDIEKADNTGKLDPIVAQTLATLFYMLRNAIIPDKEVPNVLRTLRELAESNSTVSTSSILTLLAEEIEGDYE